MKISELIAEYILDCEIKKFTHKTIKGYENNLNYLARFLSEKHQITEIENVKPIHLMGKGKKERQAAQSPYLAKMLLKYMRYRSGYFEYKNISDKLFLSRTGQPLTVEAIERIVRIAGEKANVRSDIRCSPHTCRHYFAQCQLKNGIDVYSLSRIMGHSSILITQRYLNSMNDNDITERSVKSSPLMNLL